MIRRVSRYAFIAAAIAIASSPLAARHAVAAGGPTFTVDSLLDEPDDGVIPNTCHTAANTCTLRAAIMQANRTGDGATIVLPAGSHTLTIPPSGADGESNGDLNLTTPDDGDPVISIVGAGAESTIIDANQIDRVFSIAVNRTAIISGVTIRSGYLPEGAGGGIFNQGTLTLSNVTISGNSAFYGGGIYDSHVLVVINSRIGPQNSSADSGAGILSVGDLSVRNSTIEGNIAYEAGGGIDTRLALSMRNSTISGNQARYGGGIVNSGNMIVINSTISQNDADVYGGGVYNSTGTANVYNTTIVLNDVHPDGSSGGGGAVFNGDGFSAIFNMRNTLMAGNNSVPEFLLTHDCVGTLTGYGENLLTGLVDANCTLNGSWTLLNALNTIGPLQDNGGPTWTHALLEGSNAIDGTSGSSCVDDQSVPLTTDQRGAPRVSGARCDIGAFEVPEPGSLAAAAVAIATLASLRRAGQRPG